METPDSRATSEMLAALAAFFGSSFGLVFFEEGIDCERQRTYQTSWSCSKRLERLIQGTSRLRNQEVSHQVIKVVTRGDELPESPPGGAKGIKLCDTQTVFRVCATEVGELFLQILYHACSNRLVDPWTHFDVAGVEANLPRVRRRNDHIAADEFAPVHVIAKCSGQQSQPIAAIAEDPIRLFEHRHASPLQIAGIDRHIILVCQNFEP